MILNITNGDSAVRIMVEARIPGEFLPWRDVLHEGPVPGDLALEALSRVRADFFVDQGWGEAGRVRQAFVDRDRKLASFEAYSKVVLWFEHDLYDQLQILQILDWFTDHPTRTTELVLICTENYLGLATPGQLLGLTQYEEPVTGQHLSLAREAWSAFRARSPDSWQDLLNGDTGALPFLEGAVLRLLEEYPDCRNGLSRTARSALEVVAKGEGRPGRIFQRYQDTEERRSTEDSRLNELLISTPPLLELREGARLAMPPRADQRLTITPAGMAVLSGRRDWLGMTKVDRWTGGPVDRWIGGVHLFDGHIWCWDTQARRLRRRE